MFAGSCNPEKNISIIPELLSIHDGAQFIQRLLTKGDMMNAISPHKLVNQTLIIAIQADLHVGVCFLVRMPFAGIESYHSEWSLRIWKTTQCVTRHSHLEMFCSHFLAQKLQAVKV